MIRRLLILSSVALIAACSGDTGTGSDNNGSAWDLDAGADGMENGSANNGAPDSGQNNGGQNNGGQNNGGQNNGGQNNDTNAGANAATNGSNNTIPQNNSNPDMGSTGNGNEGDACALNSECSDGLTCCAGFDGMGNCEADCFTGGLCGGDMAECGDGFECCDLSGIGAPDTCLENCRGGGGGGGGGGTPCDTNAECNGPEVCCPGLDGNGECSADCFTGGLCADDTECDNGQMCCDFGVGSKVCLDQCSF